ncbi:MAG: Sperm-associated antigen 6 [Marteilia pararefringens]
MSKLCRLLDDFEPSVKEIGALALASIVKHHPSLACDLVKLGALPQLIQSIQEPELAIKAASSQCIAEIVSHSTEMAHVAVDCGAILVLSKCLELNDPRPKRSALNALACIAKHSVDLAESIVSAEIYPSAMLLLRDVDEIVRRNTMILTKEICKQSQDLAQLMTSIGVIGATLSYLKGSPLSTGSIAESQNSLQCHAQIPALLTLGYLAAQSDTISLCLIRDKVVELLDQVLRDTKDSKLLCTAIWTLSQICQHSAEHSKSIASIPGAFENILSFVSPNSADKSELSEKAARCLRLIIQKCTYLPALEPLLVITASRPHSEILASILVQFSKVLPVEAVYRKSFVTSGCLKVIQEMQVVGSGDDAGSGLAESVVRINECFPPEIVKYYSPGYSEVLLERVDQFTIN